MGKDDELQLSLAQGARKVQGKYDEGFTILGKRFAVGDSKLPYFLFQAARFGREDR